MFWTTFNFLHLSFSWYFPFLICHRQQYLEQIATKNSESKLWLTNAVSPLHNSGITSCCYRMAHKLADNSLAGTHTRHKIHSPRRNTPCKSALKIHFGSVCNKKSGFGECSKRHFVSGVVLEDRRRRALEWRFVTLPRPNHKLRRQQSSNWCHNSYIGSLSIAVCVRLSYWDKFYHNSINPEQYSRQRAVPYFMVFTLIYPTMISLWSHTFDYLYCIVQRIVPKQKVFGLKYGNEAELMLILCVGIVILLDHPCSAGRLGGIFLQK